MTADPGRWLAAGAVLLLFLLLCAWTARRARRARGTPVVGGGGWLVAHASQTGFAEELARAAAAALEAGGTAVRLAPLGAVTPDALAAADGALLLVSTTGEGAAPDTAARFDRTVLRAPAALGAARTAVLALGDNSYAQPFAFGRRLDAWLGASGATSLWPRIEVDAGDPAALARWRAAVAGVAGAAPAEPERRVTPVVLAAVTPLNPQGAGALAALVRLEPAPGAALPDWRAGDVAELVLPLPDGALRRDYSVASLPASGALELVVRRYLTPEGEVGRGGGWLTDAGNVGRELGLHLRANGAFHAPEDPRAPMILVGAGTGIAGLRGHVLTEAAKPPADRRDLWLVFGERTRAGDFLLGEEVLGWAEAGLLTRLDLAFSRDGGGYVQDALRKAQGEMEGWLVQGAAVYACGGKDTLGQGVQQLLTDLLGEERVRELVETGRYRRDVY